MPTHQNSDPCEVGYVPVTPADTLCLWLKSATEDEAWAKLLRDAGNMPYGSIEALQKRGYRVERLIGYRVKRMEPMS